ncbi:MAG TPA: cytochrome P450 [Acidimicrobiales bacterium]|nr:cytochrome P450 [Acidimicrobiales bacterium]
MASIPVVDLDHHSRDYLDHRLERWSELRRCPVAYSEAHGGFWVVSGHQAVARVSREEDAFSSLYRKGADDGIDYMGIAGVPRPRGIPAAGIAEVDGLLHQALRRAINPFMLPGAVAELEPLMAALTTWFIDARIESGSMDMVGDLTNPVPAVITMKMVGLPLDGWEHYGEVFHAMVAYRPGDPVWNEAMAKVPDMMAGLLAEAEDRRRHPRADLLTRLVELELDDGSRMDDAQIGAVLWNLVGGGLDTTTSLTSLALHYLSTHPDQRARLAAEPDLMPLATEEFLRYYSVNETLSRTVTRDVELGGQALKAGQVILLSWLSANHDESRFESPGDIVLDRSPNPHLAFGVGPHRCIGMHVARTMFRVVVSEVLRRLPDYEVDQEATRFYSGNPTLTGVVSMPASFTPGPRLGPEERPF